MAVKLLLIGRILCRKSNLIKFDSTTLPVQYTPFVQAIYLCFTLHNKLCYFVSDSIDNFLAGGDQPQTQQLQNVLVCLFNRPGQLSCPHLAGTAM